MPVKYSKKDGKWFVAPLYQAGLKKATPETRIPVERIQAPVMVIAGGKDGMWPAAEMAQEVAKYRKSCPYGKADEVLIYPDAGHGIEIPYQSVINEGPFFTGGDPPADAQACADAWPKIVAFLQKHLGKIHAP